METKKIRHELLLDPDIAAKLCEVTEHQGATKTAIITKALKIFFERGADTEFMSQTAKRFDMLSRDLAAVRSELERSRRAQSRLEDDGAFVCEALVLFIRFSISTNVYLPMPKGEDLERANQRFERFINEVNGRLARRRSSAPPAQEGANA